MKGLLRKDYYMLFRYCRMMLLVIVVFIPLSAMQDASLFLILYPAMLVSLLPASLLSYEERDHWDSYSMTLPYTQTQLVASKYIVGLINSSVVILLSLLTYLLHMTMAASVSVTELGRLLCILVVTSCLAPAFVLPFMFRFGAEKGRLVYFAVIVLFCIVTYGSADILGKANVVLSESFFGVAAVIAFLLYGLSCVLSIRLYQKREIV